MSIEFNQEALLNEAMELTKKVIHSAEVLRDLPTVEVATAPKELVWKDGKIKLYRYSNPNIKVTTPVLITYALVNRQDMMDLQPDRSYIRNLLDLGLDIYIADWGYATTADKYTTLDDYVESYIFDMVNFISKQHKVDKINIMGVCQGGTMATIFSALHPDKIKNLITLVTPIDFSTNDGLLNCWAKSMNIDKLVNYYGTIPGTYMNDGFALLRPLMSGTKFLGLLNMLDDKDKLMNFLRMEKWINDSPNQAGETYRKFLKELYQENKLIKGELEINGKKVDLKNITMPVLNIYAEEDNLVPPASTKAFGEYVGSKDYTLYNFKGGHIGVFVGSRSHKELGPAVAKWVSDRN